MTAYVDEYNPKQADDSKYPSANRVMSDPRKLRFNNIQSCIAVGVVPDDGAELLGVHFTTMSTVNYPQEMDMALKKIKGLLKGGCDVYLAAAYEEYHSKSQLKTKLIQHLNPVRILLYDVHIKKPKGANMDVKMERDGKDKVCVFVRRHAEIIRDKSGAGVYKKEYAGGKQPDTPGKSVFMTKKKPWRRAVPKPFWVGLPR